MPSSKFVVGVLEDAAKKGDKAALEYYNVPVKHWTHKNWDEIEQRYLDIGLHSDPTPTGRQAADRRQYQKGGLTGLGDDVTKDLRIHADPERTLDMEDLGTWDDPSTVIDALMSRFPNRRQELGMARALPREKAFDELRRIMDEEGFDTIRYVNEGEGINSIEDEFFNSGEYQKLQDEIMNDPDIDPDEAPYILDEEVERILEDRRGENESYISLNPGNVRDARAAFSAENIGKPGMMLGAGGAAAGLSMGSQDAEAGIVPSRLLDIPPGIMAPDYVPQNTQSAYKLFRTDGEELYPLFVDANTPVPVGDWQKAIVGDQAASGKVKSKIGELAYRPGWHAGDNAAATHIGGKSGPGLKAPDIRPENQVWAEVLMADDLPWQEVANAQAEFTKSGNPIARTQHITDGVPYGGFYRYKTNPNMTGEWLIGGDMKVNRVLSDEEVADINASKGYSDLPRQRQSSLLDQIKERYGMLIPGATLGALGAMDVPDAAAATLDVANRVAEDTINFPLEGAQSLSNAIYDTRDAAPQVQFAPRTEAGDALSGALMEDTAKAMQFKGLIGDMPSTADLISGGMDLYNEYVSPHLTDRQEMGLGGFGAAMAGMLGFGPAGKAAKAGGWIEPTTAQRNRNVKGLESDADFAVRRDSSEVMQDQFLTSIANKQMSGASQERLMQSPMGRAIMEDAKQGQFRNEIQGLADTEQSFPVLSASQLQNTAIMPIQGDPTADGLLTRWMGVALDEPVALDAGLGFGARHYGGDNPLAWASTKGATPAIANKAQKVQEEAGVDRVLGMFDRMGDQSADFSTQPMTLANSLFRKYGDLDLDYVGRLDDYMSSVDPQWPGVQSPDLPAYLSSAKSDHRKMALAAISRSDDKLLGVNPRERGIYGPDLIRGVLDPTLRNDPVRSIGRGLMELDTSGTYQVGAMHNTYFDSVLGKKDGIRGRLSDITDYQTFMPDAYNDVVNAYPPMSDILVGNTIAKSAPKPGAKTGGYQVMTDPLLEQLVKKGLLLP